MPLKYFHFLDLFQRFIVHWHHASENMRFEIKKHKKRVAKWGSIWEIIYCNFDANELSIPSSGFTFTQPKPCPKHIKSYSYDLFFHRLILHETSITNISTRHFGSRLISYKCDHEKKCIIPRASSYSSLDITEYSLQTRHSKLARLWMSPL